MQQSMLTSLFSDRPANRSVSPESVSGWTTRAATWPSSPFALLADCGPLGWFSRTSPASCRATADGILEPSSDSWANAGMGSPTEFLTLSISEFPSGAVASSLSDVLETGDLPQRYFLSPKACAGILRRAEKRGKELPPALHAALIAAARAGAQDGGEGTTSI